MLEIKYKKNTGVITAWAGSSGHTGGHLKPKSDEKVVVFDIPNPEKSCFAYLIDKDALIDNPDYIEPVSLRAEIDELKAKIEEKK